MKKYSSLFICFLFVMFAYTIPHVSAHEVYVLSKDTIARDVANPSPNPFSDIIPDEYQFSLWGFISFMTILVVLLVSITKKVEQKIDPFLFRIKRYAPLVTRVTFGLCLIASAFYGGLFGPELPMVEFIGTTYLPSITILFYILGIFLIIGIFVRTSAFIAMLIFFLALSHYQIYMLTYFNYLGEMLITLILGAGNYSLTQYLKLEKNTKGKAFFDGLEKYSFFLLRIFFGIAVLYASFYAKFLHSNLAIDTVTQYHLTNYFHFDPLFVVLGAFIVECMIGIFFIIGFEVRFTALVFLTFLTLSLSYFAEAVWPHVILIGVNIALFLHGYDDFTIENKIFKRKNLEPVL